MNGVRVLTVNSAMSGEHVECYFLGYWRLSSRHTQAKGPLLSYLYVEAYVIDVVCGSSLGINGSISWTYGRMIMTSMFLRT